MTVLDLQTAGVVSLFAGYGGLDEGLMAVTGGRLVAVAEYEPPTKKAPRPTQAPARVLAHRHPDVPNLGDVSKIDWKQWLQSRAVPAPGGDSQGSPSEFIVAGGFP